MPDAPAPAFTLAQLQTLSEDMRKSNWETAKLTVAVQELRSAIDGRGETDKQILAMLKSIRDDGRKERRTVDRRRTKR